ncbi:MAG: metalloregulator ArsR/SmtB family transcription factor [Bacillota bacterium]|jgi:DNA-binding transcriptional ArsR family regulator
MYSPYIEAVLSLQVLYDQYHHGALLPWVIRFREHISPETYREIRYFGDNIREWLYLLDLALDLPDLGRMSFGEVVDHIASLPTVDFVFRLLGEQVPPMEIQAVFENPANAEVIYRRLGITNPRRKSELSRLFESPAEVQRELCRFLVSYWDQHFEEEFHWVELLLVKGIKDEAKRLEEESLPRFLTRISGGLITRDKKVRRAHADHVIIENVAGPIEIALADLEEIVLFPSLFVAPQSIFELSGGRLLMSYSIPPGVYLRRDTLVPPEHLSRLLKTLADETRLKIMKLMMQDRQCTQGLAVELGLAEPTISRHLKLLREADLISGEKEGNYIYYNLRLEKIAELHMKILDFLRN